MYEVEVKIRAAHDPVRESLEDRAAEFVGRVEQVDTYFDAPHRDFAARDEALRIRAERSADEEKEEAVITYKGPLVEAESKTREEIETGIESLSDMQAVLEALGFEPAATVEKTRDRYRVDGFTISLDSVSGLGEFVEIEAEVSGDEIEPTREVAVAVLD